MSNYDPNFMFHCGCGLCLFLRTYFGAHGGWCDPRRGYLESESDFLRRVPDGFLTWPADHNPTKPDESYFLVAHG